MADPKKRPRRDYNNLPESEPYLGPGWAVLMLILYFLKEAFPAERLSVLWWVQMYVLLLVIAMTIFIMLKRRAYFKRQKRRDDD